MQDNGNYERARAVARSSFLGRFSRGTVQQITPQETVTARITVHTVTDLVALQKHLLFHPEEAVLIESPKPFSQINRAVLETGAGHCCKVFHWRCPM